MILLKVTGPLIEPKTGALLKDTLHYITFSGHSFKPFELSVTGYDFAAFNDVAKIHDEKMRVMGFGFTATRAHLDIIKAAFDFTGITHNDFYILPYLALIARPEVQGAYAERELVADWKIVSWDGTTETVIMEKQYPEEP